MAASITVGGSAPAVPPTASTSADQMSPVNVTVRSVSAGSSTDRYSSMCLAGVANGIFRVDSTLDLWASPMPSAKRFADRLLHGERLGREHQRVPRPRRDDRGADLDGARPAPIIAMAVSASGTASWAIQYDDEAGGLRLGGVVDDLGERGAQRDES